jgi:hypothetical protein
MKNVTAWTPTPWEWPTRCWCGTDFTAELSDVRGRTVLHEDGDGYKYDWETFYVCCPGCGREQILEISHAAWYANGGRIPGTRPDYQDERKRWLSSAEEAEIKTYRWDRRQ